MFRQCSILSRESMKSFDRIMGHDRICRILEKSVASDRVSQAYLFGGPEGIGKYLVAKQFAQLLTCENRNGCGICRSCRTARNGLMMHPDIKLVSNLETPLWIERSALLDYCNNIALSSDGSPDSHTTELRREDTYTGVELLTHYATLAEYEMLTPPIALLPGTERGAQPQRAARAVYQSDSDASVSLTRLQRKLDQLPKKHVRAREVAQALFNDIGPETYLRTIRISLIRTAVQGTVASKPYLGSAKVYILDDAHNMTEEAQNCLLKTLEEPPSHTVIILVTAHVEKLLPTIRSRCRIVNFGTLRESVVSRTLEERFDTPPEQALLRSAISGGSMGRALNEDWETFFAMREQLLNGLVELSIGRLDEVFLYLDRFLGPGSDPIRMRKATQILSIWCHDMLVMEAGMEESCIFRDYLPKLRKQSEWFSSDRVMRFRELLDRFRELLDRNVHPELAVEAEFMRFLVK